MEHAHYQAQVLVQKGKFISTFCDCMQGALNCVENWCIEMGLSVNADKTTMVLFTNNRKIGGFYNFRFCRTELRITDQVKYLGVILLGKGILKIGCTKFALHIDSIVVLWERLENYHRW
jgi:hypothetical protein